MDFQDNCLILSESDSYFSCTRRMNILKEELHACELTVQLPVSHDVKGALLPSRRIFTEWAVFVIFALGGNIFLHSPLQGMLNPAG